MLWSHLGDYQGRHCTELRQMTCKERRDGRDKRGGKKKERKLRSQRLPSLKGSVSIPGRAMT